MDFKKTVDFRIEDGEDLLAFRTAEMFLNIWVCWAGGGVRVRVKGGEEGEWKWVKGYQAYDRYIVRFVVDKDEMEEWVEVVWVGRDG